jgi:uncharacterized protein
MQTETIVPWYRQPWPWILMAAPVAAVLAGAVTIGLAIGSFDGLVAEDYYKQGLAVNQRLARAQAAQALDIAGTLQIDPAAGGAVRLDLSTRQATLPPVLRLTLSHPTRAGLDQQVRLVAAAGGRYVGRAGPLAPARWHAIVEDEAGQWRIHGQIQAPQMLPAELRGAR